jgi:hypothetical protein
MMKKVLFILVLLMAALLVNAQIRTTPVHATNPPTSRPTPPPPPGGGPRAGQRIQLPGYGTFCGSFIVKKRAVGVAKIMSQGATKMPTSKQNEGVRTGLTAAELPKPIIDNVATDFAGYTIKDGAKVVKDKALSFEVYVTKGRDAGTIVYEQVEENLEPKH